MKEELLHFVWQSKLLLGKTLTTVGGEPISIIHLGTHNTNAGPDFFNAKVQIGDTLWAGNIEMHVRTSEWDRHNHQHDPAYNNVILHVVYTHDKDVKAASGESIPTLELRNFIPATLLKRYAGLQQQQSNRIPCEKILDVPSPTILSAWLQRLLVERVERKCDYIKELLVQTNHHYEQSFYILTARYFGMKTNAEPFEQLAKQLPLTVIAKHKNSIDDIMALVLGVSGLLPDMKSPFKFLVPRYAHLQQKYALHTLDKKVWKFGRVRPANTPTVRLVQFATLLFQSSHLLSNVLESKTIDDLTALYREPIKLGPKKVQMGIASVHLLLLNSVLPFVFLYGKLQHQEELCDKALNWYEQLPGEKNAITRLFHSLGFKSKSAADTQAFIQLKNEYCTTLNCLKCSIGFQTLLHA